MKTYVLIGSNVGTQGMAGKVVASADHIYMYRETVVSASLTSSLAPMFGLAGVVVGMIADASAKKKGPPSTRAAVFKFDDLPPEITGHADWPCRPKKNCDVLIYPRSMIDAIKKQWPNRFLIIADALGFKVDHKLFAGAKIKQDLIELGWTIK